MPENYLSQMQMLPRQSYLKAPNERVSEAFGVLDDHQFMHGRADEQFDRVFDKLRRGDGPRPRSFLEKLGQTWPARMAQDAYSAFQLPGQVYRGEVPVTGPDGRSNPDVIIRAADLAGMVTGGSYAMPAMQGGAGMGIRAYHGSPHKFDKFDMNKVGTGEGTQMEGFGLYFGQSPEVADFYHKSTVKELIARRAREAQPMYPEQQRQLVGQIEGIIKKEGIKALDEYVAPAGYDAAWSAAVDAAKNFKRMKGSRYEVNINANLDDFYDLDKPLREQTPKVYDAINRVGRDPRWAMDRIPDDARGAQLRPILKNPEAVAELRNLGIPGSKYWDQFSRKDGEGTKNLVVFDDSLISILRKYGIAGAAAVPAAASQYQEQ